jgi:hypothetical protein
VLKKILPEVAEIAKDVLHCLPFTSGLAESGHDLFTKQALIQRLIHGFGLGPGIEESLDLCEFILVDKDIFPFC